ncbi:hypothetical protein H9Q74_010510 [Fusarium xylarioides]|nr:hypothetical protein H9Q74_010510 [Fusarium xylarioides]
MLTIEPFQINIPDSKLERLKQKLALADFPTDDSQSWERGAPVGDVKRLTKIWQTTFDWRAVEYSLNKLPHYIASLEIGNFGALDVHFIHKRSARVDAIPLLFLHGWPGSFIEVTRILDPLIHENSGPSFHVIAPSLIDFGFSSASKPGFKVEDHAEIYDRLMNELGYEKYAIQAGDVGSIIARSMAASFGNSRCMALHTNTPLPSEPRGDTHPDLYNQPQKEPLTEAELKALARAGEVSKVGMGYYNIQSTKPTTIGFSLRDSPVGLLAWMYEKLVEWSDAYEWTDEEILTWVSIYWFSTAGPDAPSNLYHSFEQSDPVAFAAAGTFINLPLGISRFTNDLVLLPKLWNQTLGPVVFEKEHERGGHFAAWEQPSAIVGDLRLMFGDFDVEQRFKNRLEDRTTV